MRYAHSPLTVVASIVEIDETRAVEVVDDENIVTYQAGEPVIETVGSNSVSPP